MNLYTMYSSVYDRFTNINMAGIKADPGRGMSPGSRYYLLQHQDIPPPSPGVPYFLDTLLSPDTKETV